MKLTKPPSSKTWRSFMIWWILGILAMRPIDLEFPALSPRLVKVNKIYSDLIVPESGIVPGCGKANHCARSLLYHVLDKAHRDVKIVRIRQLVDDISARVEGPPEIVGPAIVTAATTL
eukprot:8119698-Pyramimonas_sp.AAC.1